MDVPSRASVLFVIVLLLYSTAVLVTEADGSDLQYDEDIVIGFDEYWMDQELGPDRYVSSELPIHWYARDPDDLTLIIELYIMPVDGYEWTMIVEDAENTGTYIWDLEDPSVPDGDYILKVLAWNHNGCYSCNTSSFAIHVHNRIRPDVALTTSLTEMECSGKVMVNWSVTDGDHDHHHISSKVFISPDNGQTFDLVYSYQEDPGWCVIDTTDLLDGDSYRLKVEVEDPDGLKDSDVSGRFAIFNNVAPTVDLVSPSDGMGLFGTVKVEWEAFDRNEPRDRLRVDLWYVTVHDGARFDLMIGARNGGSYSWNTSSSESGPQGHRLCIRIIDSNGASSFVDEVQVWIYHQGDPIIIDPVLPPRTVRDSIPITWDTSKPAQALSPDISLTVYHKKPGTEYAPVAVQVENNGSFSIDVSSGPDGFHDVRIVLMDPLRTWIHDELVVKDILVYHEMEPEILIREAPANGTDLTTEMLFEVAGFDGNGDVLTYMGLYSLKGGGWQIFDTAYGGYRQRLIWNTTGVQAGEYEVRIAAYDSSSFNLSTSVVLGPYHLYENRTPMMPLGQEDGDEGRSSLLIVSIIASCVVLLIVLIGLIIIGRRSGKRVKESDMSALRMNPEYVRSYLRRAREGGVFERLLPSAGGSSADRMMSDLSPVSTGLTEDDIASLQGYLDMLDPDLVDDVNPSDVDSYVVLGIGADASEEEIRKAYKEFVKRFHPDRFASQHPMMFLKAQEEFRKKNRAKTILLDHRKRAILDRMIRETEGSIIRSASMRSVDQIRKFGKKE
ncbi:MAG: J domain-containing protein [Thermoplasmatota archaeon]